MGAHGGTPYEPGTLGPRNKMIKSHYGNFPDRVCWHPTKSPIIAAAYFMVFVIIAAFIILSLFIGAVVGGMNDALDAFKQQEYAAKVASLTADTK
jgi:hypothetical protein